MSTINLSVIYRPPNSSVPFFAIDFLDLLEKSINENGRLLILGDFNIPINNPDSSDTNIFQDVLDSLGLHNHIAFPTHRQQNTLDLIITEHQENLIRKLNQGRLFSVKDCEAQLRYDSSYMLLCNNPCLQHPWWLSVNQNKESVVKPSKWT